MKTYFILFTLVIAFSVSAQKPGKITGLWEGKLNVGITLRLVFEFNVDSTGNIAGTSYSPDQGNEPLPCSNINVKDDSVSFVVEIAHAGFAGKFENDSLISGKLTQGRSFDLVLSKVVKVSKLARPQTPQPPFNYISEEVGYDNADKSLHYGATITMPHGTGLFPAILLVTGSGAQNRDEEIFEHKPFLVIADYFTRQGYIVMRVDDRGIGESSGNFNTATTEDFAKDVNTSLNYLKKLKHVDTTRLGMLGHSEGGMIAPMLASQRNDVKFIILLAAPGEKIPMLMEQQNVAILKSVGYTQKAVEAYDILYRTIIDVIMRTGTKEEAEMTLNKEVNEWKKNTPKDIVAGTTGIINDSTQGKFVTSFYEELSSPWYSYFLRFDPAIYLENVRCKVLALNGDKDLQVNYQTNLNGIRDALKKSNSPSYEVKEIPGLNHLFQNCKSCTVSEYGQLEETFSPKALGIISEWLYKNVK